MAIRVCILGSGSSGNATLVGSDSTHILIDAGLSARELDRRLKELQLSASSLAGICVSHEHSDHTAGLRVLNLRHGVRLFGNAGTIEALNANDNTKGLQWQVFSTGMPFTVGDLQVEPFSVPHDAYDPVGFVVACGASRVGIVTDIGVPTSLVRERLRTCHAVVLESNHDETMLKDAERPWYLKQRIMGRQGHLSNERAASMLAEIATPDLSHVFLAHLSEQCNSEELAVATMRKRLDQAGHSHVKVCPTYPDRISEVWVHAS